MIVWIEDCVLRIVKPLLDTQRRKHYVCYKSSRFPHSRRHRAHRACYKTATLVESR